MLASAAERVVEKLGRVPALVDGDVANDESVEGAQVRIGSGQLLRGSLAHGARVAGQRRVDKHQVRFVQQRVLVGDELEGRPGGGLGAVSLDAHR
jgi:hypothetical protein